MRAQFVRAGGRAPLAVAVLVLVFAGGAHANRVTGTAGADRLVGSPMADRLDGRGGNDTLVGLGGNDVLLGGPGSDRLVGGPGADVLDCGPGKDLVVADTRDTIRPSCEVVKGIPKPSLSIADASGAEGNSGTTTFSFAVTLSAATPLPVSVRFATSDGTATGASDYAPTTGVLAFKPRERRKVVAVAVAGDASFEQDEAFTVGLSDPVNATIADGSAIGTITNDDPPPARPGLFAGQISSRDFPGREFIGFQVFDDGRSVGNFHFVFIADCQPEGTFQFAPVSIPGVAGTIQPGKTFSIDAHGQGTTEIRVSGRFDAAGTSASGSFQAHVGFTQQGSHYECDTGERTWSAKWGPLGPQLQTSVSDTGGLVMSFDEGDLEKYASVSYRLDASRSTSWSCGGQTIQTQDAPTGTTTGLVPNAKGHVLGRIELAAPTPPSSCSGAALERVDYTQVKFTNLTTGRSTFTGPFGRSFP